MNGTIISFILGGVVFLSLNHKVFDNFFKIKRQRVYKPGESEDSEVKVNKVSSIKSAKAKRKFKNKPPAK